MAGKLSIVSTPIGNLGDISLRALGTLKSADVILAEDTRTTGKLLAHYDVPRKQLISFFEGNEERRMNSVIALLAEGKHVVLVSESGTPLISDPGYKLVRGCVEVGIQVEAVPGVTAFVAALTVSGLPSNAFLFLGYLPHKDTNARKWLDYIRRCLDVDSPIKTAILYESPHRLLRTLRLIKDLCGDIDVVVARELTKVYEEVRRETVLAALAHFGRVKPRGEFVVLFSF